MLKMKLHYHRLKVQGPEIKLNTSGTFLFVGEGWESDKALKLVVLIEAGPCFTL